MYDYGNQTLPNLEGFVKDKYGVYPSTAQIKDNGENSIDPSMQRIVGEANTDQSSAGGKTASRIAESAANEKAVFPNSRALYISDESKASALYYVPSSAYLHGTSNGTFSEKEAALATITDLGGGSYVFCTGTSGATDVYFSDSAVYADRDMYLAVIDSMTDGDVPFGIDFKIIKSEGLDLTKHQATLQMIIICAAIPAAVLALGTVVYVRRKHS